MLSMTRACSTILLSLLATGCVAAPPPPLDQPPPGAGPVLFAPGIVSTPGSIELDGALAPDGREFFFTRIVDGVDTLHCSRLVGGAWSEPVAVHPCPNGLRARAADMGYAPDGKRLYFLGTTPEGSRPDGPMDLWAMDRTADGARMGEVRSERACERALARPAPPPRDCLANERPFAPVPASAAIAPREDGPA
jgi:hypothetical protein